MDANTTRQITRDYTKEIIDRFRGALDEGERQGYRMAWNFIKEYSIEHWKFLALALVGILLFSFLIYLTTGRWAMLGSVLYHYLYIVFLLIMTVAFGPEIFANTFIDIILVVVYVACFILVGSILKRTGIKT